MDVNAAENGIRNALLIFGNTGRHAGAGLMRIPNTTALAGVYTIRPIFPCFVVCYRFDPYPDSCCGMVLEFIPTLCREVV